jgi:drug/metabolite transporter (DMT)-like permease
MISRQKKLNIIGIILMLLTTIVWGSAFLILKNAMNSNPKTFIISIRFFGAGLIMCLIYIKSLLKADKKSLICGFILGAICAGGYYFQTLGLEHTTPSRNAFITATYCVVTPFMLWAIKKIKPKSYSLISAIICIIGIGLISFSGQSNDTGSNLILGDGLTLFSTVFFALQIIFIDSFSQSANPKVVLPVQVVSAGIILFIVSAITELPFHNIEDFIIKGDNIFNVCYLMLACTLFCQFGQFYGQLFSSSSSQSALILSLESVFGAIFSIIFGSEKVSLLLVIGFVVVFLATIIAVMRIDVLSLFKKKKKE